MLNPRILVILTELPDGEAALSMALDALAQAKKPYGLRFAAPEGFLGAFAQAELPAGTLNAGDVKFFPDAAGLPAVPELLTDETHFLFLRGAYAFTSGWDALLLARYAKIPVKKAVMTAVPAVRETVAQAYLPAFTGEMGLLGARLGAGLALVRCVAPVKTMLIHPNFLFGPIAFLHGATLATETLSIAAYAAGYAVFALDAAPLAPAADVPPPEAWLNRPPLDMLPGNHLARFEQLAAFSFAGRTAAPRAMSGVFGLEDVYKQNMPLSLLVTQRARALLGRETPLPLTISAFVDLTDAHRPAGAYLLRFSFLKALGRLPLLLYTGGAAERRLRAGFPNTLAYPDNALLPRALLAEGITPTRLFERNKLLLLERALAANPSYRHVAWLDMDALPHPVCPQAALDFSALTDDRVHLGWVESGPDTSLLVAPARLLHTLAKEVRAVTQLDAAMERSFSERRLYRRLIALHPQMFTLHPLPRRGLLFFTCLPPSLLSAPLQQLLAGLAAPVRVPDNAPEEEEKEGDADA